MKKKLSEKTWFILLMCILFFPVGLYLLWIKSSFNKSTKLVITSIVAILVVTTIVDESDTVDQANKVVATVENPKPKKENQVKVNEEKKAKPKEVKKQLSDLEPNEMLEDIRFKANMNRATEYFIEEYEKQIIKKVTNKVVAVYNSNPVHDQAGAEFLYSFMVTGRYEEKGTGALKDFIMTLAFKDDEQLKVGNASCIQYINNDTGINFNVMNPEDDVILKMMESLKQN